MSPFALPRSRLKSKHLSEDFYLVLIKIKDSLRFTLYISPITHQPLVDQTLTLAQSKDDYSFSKPILSAVAKTRLGNKLFYEMQRNYLAKRKILLLRLLSLTLI